ncbi:VOC family protein [Georgenia sp. H159]|uniref:VOC family protein n=1 Tax=Georgenia sp. H159 TaxID=3076115 RepID=UPI002D79D375|nr:VOC family protein [Georgenia sp. H159]
MATTSIYPVLMVDDVAGAADFFRDHLGFTTTFAADWYISLRHGTWELALLDAAHPTVPDRWRGARAQGVLVNVEVDDVDSVYRRLVEHGPLEAVLPLRSEAFGQRHFIVEGPAGALVDVITPIEPDESFAAQFSGA